MEFQVSNQVWLAAIYERAQSRAGRVGEQRPQQAAAHPADEKAARVARADQPKRRVQSSAPAPENLPPDLLAQPGR